MVPDKMVAARLAERSIKMDRSLLSTAKGKDHRENMKRKLQSAPFCSIANLSIIISVRKGKDICKESVFLADTTNGCVRINHFITE